jgi:methionine biosynthesis protein MetW
VEIVHEAFRVGRQVIIAYSNFGHYRVRLQVLFQGRTPITRSLPTPWHQTRNLHFLSVADFESFCRDTHLHESKRAFFSGTSAIRFLPNLRAETAVSLLNSSGVPENK